MNTRRAVLQWLFLVIIGPSVSFGQPTETQDREDVCMYAVNETSNPSERFEKNRGRPTEWSEHPNEWSWVLVRSDRSESILQIYLNESQNKENEHIKELIQVLNRTRGEERTGLEHENGKIIDVLRDQSTAQQKLVEMINNRSLTFEKELLKYIQNGTSSSRSQENEDMKEMRNILKEQQKQMDTMLQVLVNNSQRESRGIERTRRSLKRALESGTWKLTSRWETRDGRQSYVANVRYRLFGT